MKICFLPPSKHWAVQFGHLKRWENLMQIIPRVGNGYQVVDDQSLADYIVTSLDESEDVIGLVRPLSRRDIRTFTWDAFDQPAGRYSGFYCALPKNLFDARRHTTISYPGPFNELIEDFPKHEAVLDFSFLGQITAGVRKQIIDLLGPGEMSHNSHIRISSSMAWSISDDRNSKAQELQAKRDYADLFRRSKFVLCPRGAGTGSYRMFEAMQAGRVPVIISDDYVKPAGIDWDSCSLTIAESKVADIPSIIVSRMSDWETLAANARAIWEAHFSPDHIMDFVATNLLRMAAEIDRNAFSSLAHSLRVGTSVFPERIRPVLGAVKNRILGFSG